MTLNQNFAHWQIERKLENGYSLQTGPTHSTDQ